MNETNGSGTMLIEETTPVNVVLQTCIVALVSFCIICANLVNVVALRRTHQLPVISRICLLNLSAADLIVGLVACAPAVYPAVTGTWPYGAGWCQISGVTHGVSVAISIWSLTMFSIDRYIAVVHCLRYHSLVTETRVRAVFAGLWMLAAGTYTAPILASDDFVYFHYTPSELMCGMYWSEVVLCLVTAFCIPVMCITVLIYTAVRINKTMQSMRAFPVIPERCTRVTPFFVSGAMTSRCKDAKPPSPESPTEPKTSRLLFFAVVAFALLWGPYVMITVIIALSFGGILMPPELRFVCMWLANCNSFINVVIYSATYKEFRDNVVAIFRCRSSRVSSSTNC